MASSTVKSTPRFSFQLLFKPVQTTASRALACLPGMQALPILNACSIPSAAFRKPSIPRSRARARTTGTSLNEAAVDALVEGSGAAGSRRKRRDLGDIARTWKADKAVAAALADQDRVDEDLWR